MLTFFKFKIQFFKKFFIKISLNYIIYNLLIGDVFMNNSYFMLKFKEIVLSTNADVAASKPQEIGNATNKRSL